VDIRSAQKLAWENKLAKGFNTTDVPLEFCLLQGEIAEAFHAWRHRQPDTGEELADVALYLLSVAEMTGIDLQAEIEHKITKNAARIYQRDETTGILVRTAEADIPPRI
jgi:NTP pyrophosphatase (non-canonical NTP hydrolase)